MVAAEHERRLADYEGQVAQLQETIKGLEEEVVVLRRRLQDAPKRVRTLEERLLETKGQLAQAVSQNEKLSATLREAREHIAALREDVEKLTMPPSGYGTYLGINDDGTADIFTAGRKMRVALHPELDAEELRRGQEVVLNESLNVVLARGTEVAGEVVTFKELLEDGTRAFVVGRADEERVCELAQELLGIKLHAGDHLLMEARSGLLLEKLPRPEVEELVLEEVPDVSYDDVGGLDDQIEMIKDAVELPYLYGDLFREHELQPPKGILLYGPPGCGKTLIAKAVANSLAKRVAEKTGNASARSYFLNIKGPELLNKYVGETERQIRLIFERAREKSEEGNPVIVFFDEMDSLFRTRGTGISSDIESTIVPQLLAEIDGVESLKNVIVIGASNREDLIDPAILRPGRLDVKIKIERPDAVEREADLRAVPHPEPADRGDRVEEHRRRRAEGGLPDDRRRGRAHVRHRGREQVPRGDVPERRQGAPVLQGLLVGRHDREHRAAREEAVDQAHDRGRRARHHRRRPARLDQAGIPRARGLAQHHQPRRLGEDLGQEGRADRLRAHDRERGRGRPGRPADRTGHDRSVPVGRQAPAHTGAALGESRVRRGRLSATACAAWFSRAEPSR